MEKCSFSGVFWSDSFNCGISTSSSCISHLYSAECSNNWLQPTREESSRSGGDLTLRDFLSWWLCSWFGAGECKQLSHTQTEIYAHLNSQIFIPNTRADFHSSALTFTVEPEGSYFTGNKGHLFWKGVLPGIAVKLWNTLILDV